MRFAAVIDEVPLVRTGILTALATIGMTGVEVEGRNAVDGTGADLVVVGKVGRERVVDLIRGMKFRHGDLRVAALVTSASRTDLLELLALGTDAILLRSSAPAELVAAVRAIGRGELVIGAALQSVLGVREITRPMPESDPLTAREREVLLLLAQGSSNREIASSLYVTLATVKTHLAHIYDKLDASNRNEALSRAVHLGLLA